MSEIFFNGIWRMDWGFGNPNKTAAFIAILMIAVCALTYFRKIGFWIALSLFVGLGIALVHTFSRGGLVSLATGIVPLLIWAPRPWPRARLIAGVLALWVIVGATIYLKAHERYAQGVSVEDRSISNRFQIWKSAPAMMVDAPEGWGLGKAGDAYMQWYQPLDKHESYRTLVNSHLTWLVECGWLARIAYILGWSLILLICWPSDISRWRSVCLGVWLSFFVSAFFSSVAESPVIWIVPILALVAAVIGRLLTRDTPLLHQWMAPFSATALIVIALWITGRTTSASIAKSGDAIVVGNGDPATWILYDSATMGTLYGKSLRKFYLLNPQPTGFLFSIPNASMLAGKNIVLGSLPPKNQLDSIKAALNDLRQVILLNPHFSPVEIGVNNAHRSKISSYFGDFSQSPSTDAWASVGDSEQIAGAGDFLANWPSLIFTNKVTNGKN